MQKSLESFVILASWLAICPPAARSGTYPQLISTQYDKRAALPAGALKPAVALEHVDSNKLPNGLKVTSTARSANGRIWLLTDQGPFRSTATGYEPLVVGPRQLEPGQPPVTGNAQITALVADKPGHIWVGTDRGVYVCNGEEWWQKLDGPDGVPFEKINCLHLASGGDVWAGTPEGAWRLRDGRFQYFWGKRWLRDDDVQAIWTDATGRAWIETKTGVACIEDRPTTLGEKAAHYDRIIQQRHNRRGYIAAIDLETPGDATKGTHFDVSDNDGLWTSLYVAAMAMRFAVTKAPAAREQARKSMNAMLDLERLSGIPGFPARAMVTDDELKAGAHGFNLDAKVHALGETAKAWYRSPTTAGLWCKGDTSSDELDGHYFAWYLYHDLVALEAEKKEIAAVVRRVTDGIIRNNYTLVDHTGRKTRWGIWSPELINGDPRYRGLRALNSLEILSYLKVAEHITGDPKYAQAADSLIQNHHYLLNGLLMRRGRGAQWPYINHSDDELLYLVYYPLLTLEKDPSRHRLLLQSICRTWEEVEGEQSIRPEHNPFYNFIYGASTGRRCDVDEARATLQDWPWDLIAWSTKNSHRHDVSIRTATGIRRNKTQLDRVLSPAERTQARWNANPWNADWGDDGHREDDGVAWTVAYWLGVYHDFLSPDE
jgi:two component regulator with propeller domain